MSDKVDWFNKVTVGFVIQTFKQNHNGKMVCVAQSFVAGDEVDYENIDGEPVALEDRPDYEYEPFEMVKPEASVE
tara:strand:+ start:24339 stop:24563 length:225 start_codon:yes stop_codon:yes gene_type:complete